MPGPANYNIKSGLKNVGTIFGTSKRCELGKLTNNKVPGPGSYNVLSEELHESTGPKYR